MNPARLLLSLIAGLAAALIAFSAFYVRGDGNGVMQFLHERSVAKRLIAAGANAEQIAAAKAKALAVAQSFADPAWATRMIPVALLIGLVIGSVIWQLFGVRLAQAQTGRERADVQERMVLRFAHRRGGQFTLQELSERSPLTAEQAYQVTARMLERGQLRREGDGGYHL